MLACALTGLLVSPISWDHHWVWIVPGVAVAAAYAVRAMRAPEARALAGVTGGASPPAAAPARLRWRRPVRWPAAGYWALAGGMLALYGAWPGSLWSQPEDLSQFSLGLLWQPPGTDPAVYYRDGDQPWFAEYHWHGIELLTGNAFVLGGLVLLGVLIAAAIRTRVTTSPTGTSPGSPPAPPAPPAALPRPVPFRDHD